jgi:hypothetical protein
MVPVVFHAQEAPPPDGSRGLTVAACSIGVELKAWPDAESRQGLRLAVRSPRRSRKAETAEREALGVRLEAAVERGPCRRYGVIYGHSQVVDLALLHWFDVKICCPNWTLIKPNALCTLEVWSSDDLRELEENMSGNAVGDEEE